MSSPTAAILLIGDEILSGKIKDSNAAHAIISLREAGIDLRRLLVVPDLVDDIADAVKELSGRYDYVFTSGGVGPTHDDVTMEAVAKAFGVKLERDAELERRLRSYFGAKLEERSLRMADVPEGTTLIEGDHPGWPAMALRNVFILPGIPEIFRRKFDAVRSRLRGTPFHLRNIYVNENEVSIAHSLDRVVGDWPTVRVGSYPHLDATDYQVKVTLEGLDPVAVDAARKQLLDALGSSVVRTEP